MDLPDFREPMLDGLDWLHRLVAGVQSDQLALPTPCEDWDVRELIAHLHLVTERLRVVGGGGNAMSVTPEDIELDDDPASGFGERVAAARRAWAEEESLSRQVIVPWGEVPGAVALAGYLPEVVAHGWDLAVATAQPSEADPSLAAMALGAAEHAIPAERDGFPFGPVVESAPDDSPTTRFVHWMGRA